MTHSNPADLFQRRRNTSLISVSMRKSNRLIEPRVII